MSESHDNMIQALKEIAVPYLREIGFKGSFPHFRRILSDRVDMLTFQFNKYGGSFVVEVANCPAEGIRTHQGEEISPAKVKAWDVTERLRLGSNPPRKTDYWFKFKGLSKVFSKDKFASTAQEVLPFIKGQAEDYWRTYHKRIEREL
jgi:hypothetical protein